MKRKSRGKRSILKNESGFTLIEMLIVVIVLGILAMIIVPQITVSTEDAKLRTLQTNLSTMRSAIETYYAQHDNTYPGTVKDDGTAESLTAVEATTAFEKQLTYFSKATGATSVSVDNTFPYGPYIKGGKLPKNPFNDKDTVIADITTTNITARTFVTGDDAYGWKFFVKTGVLIPADGSTTAFNHSDL